MTKEKIEKELLKVREFIEKYTAKEKKLEEELKMAEDAEKIQFIEKHKISLEQLTLLNQLSEGQLKALLKEKEAKENEKMES